MRDAYVSYSKTLMIFSSLLVVFIRVLWVAFLFTAM